MSGIKIPPLTLKKYPKLRIIRKAKDTMKEMIFQINRFIKKKIVRGTVKRFCALPFHFGKANLPWTFLAYQPDSHTYCSNHNEFHELFKSFKAHNKFNNSGDVTRLWSFILNIKQILAENIPGDFAELGVWRGNTASVLAHYASKANRNVYLFDTFEGFDAKELKGIDEGVRNRFTNTSLSMVKDVIGKPSEVCEFVQGHFPSTVSDDHKKKTFSIVSLDCDLYEPTKAGLEFFYPLMPRGGLLLLHDYSSMQWPGSKKAIDEFCIRNEEYVILMPDKSGSAFIRKSK